MGGYVARLTPILHPETRPFLRDIITLATPHANPLYAWDETVYSVHQRLLQEQQQQQKKIENETLIVSLSGGLRDEMIAPLACDASLQPTSISV
jgi:PGAP1-like protein